MMLAQVIIDNPFLNKVDSLSYIIPQSLEKEIRQGSIVSVPFRKKHVLGIVIQIEKENKSGKTKLRDILTLHQKIYPSQLKMADFIADYYLCPKYKAYRLFLPPKLPEGKNISYFYALKINKKEAQDIIKKKKNATQQNKILKELLEKNLIDEKNFSAKILKKLLEKNLIQKIPLERAIKQSLAEQKLLKHELTSSQKEIIEKIQKFPAKKNLLFGLSASGKTEIYLNLSLEAIKQNKQVLILSPEIGLISHLYTYLKSFFPQTIAFLHSKLTPRKKTEIWEQIREGKIKIVIGSKIALFQPYQNLGLLIIDEEHDGSYKGEQSPRYDCRLLAKKIDQFYDEKPIVIFSSATPSLESHFEATNKADWQILFLKKEHNSFQITTKIIDMREELKKKNYSIFSEYLLKSLTEKLNRKEKSLIIINRRGFARSVLCRDCGQKINCKNCQTPLTLYRQPQSSHFFCHHCGQKSPYLLVCPNCKSINIKEISIGIQRVESELKKIFPMAKIESIDGGIIKKSDCLNLIKEKIENADILIGTQIIAKGFDLKNLTLSCILLADLELCFPNFDTSEKAYQLFKQTQGRVGRHKNGEFIIQTYNPEIIQSLKLNSNELIDYQKFAEKELTFRKTLNLPPYCKMLRLNFNGTEEIKKKVRETENLLKQKAERLQIKAAIQSAPDLLYRKKGLYNWHIIIKGDNPRSLIDKENLNDFIIDVDPKSNI